MAKFDPGKSYCNTEYSVGLPYNSCCYHHDQGYKYPGSKPRSYYDKALYDCMADRGYKVRAVIFYVALKLFGWIRWEQLRARERRGEAVE